MLEEMGLRLWLPETRSGPGDDIDRGGHVAAGQAPRIDDMMQDPAVARPAPPPRVRPAPEPAMPTPTQPVDSPVATASMAWPELREAVSTCTACRLCSSRKTTVFGVGHPRAHWMIIGEAPGEHEDLQGEPFVGKSGQLLDGMLRALGLTRAEDTAERQVYIANTVKCRPPSNRNPAADELAACEPFLIRQIELVQPRIILAMGRFALQSLLRSNDPVGRLRGRVHTYRGVPLVATYHPAYLLRNPEEKARTWDDLCLAREVVARHAD